MLSPSGSQDELVIAVSRDGLLRARVARTPVLCGEAARRHSAGPLATHALARALTCAALYPTSFKDCARLSLQFSGAGPLRSVLAELRAGPSGEGLLRGFTKAPAATLWAADPRARAIGRALAPGSLQVLRQQPDGTFAQGLVELDSGEIDEDLEHYFSRSEQIPTRLRCAVELDDNGQLTAAVGALVQVLPGGDAARVEELSLKQMTAGDKLDEVLAHLLGEPVIKERLPLRFACPCNRERALGGISLLDVDAVIEMIAVEHGAEVRCEFCATVYRFTPDDLLPLVESKGGSA